jgi:asparagine synthase (glutamine-hydrolysing)
MCGICSTAGFADRSLLECKTATMVHRGSNDEVEFMAKVPASLKVSGLTTKYLFRQATPGIVTDEVIVRRKAGFGAPIRNWLGHDLRLMIDQVLSDSSLRSRGILDPAAVQRMLEQNASGTHDRAYRIWALLTLEMWMQTFVDRRRPLAALSL